MSNSKKKTKAKSIKLPSKRSINLAANLEKQLSMIWAIPGSIIIIVLACLFSKYFVVDRLNQLDTSMSEVREIQTQIDELYEAYNNMESVSEDYAHYTFSGLRADEEQYFNRMEVVKLIENKIFPYAVVNNYQLKENVLVVPMRAPTLKVVKEVVARLEEDELVDFCIMTNANTTEATDEEEGYVTAQVTIYLNNLEGGDLE